MNLWFQQTDLKGGRIRPFVGYSAYTSTRRDLAPMTGASILGVYDIIRLHSANSAMSAQVDLSRGWWNYAASGCHELIRV